MFNVSDVGIPVFELQQKLKLFQAIWLFFGSGFCVEFVRRWILPPMEELLKELKWTEFLIRVLQSGGARKWLFGGFQN